METSGVEHDARRKHYYDVFVSSTAKDLGAHREATRRAIEVLRQHPISMEDFGAQAVDGASVSTAEVAACDLFLLVIAWRYGAVPASETRSITELEYLESQRLGKPCLIFLADNATQAPDGPDDLFPAGLRDPEHAEKLAAFRASVLPGHVVATFTTPESLYEAVVRAVSGWLLAQPAGARPPRDVPRTARDFVGREDPVARLLDRLRAGQSAAISAAVVGMAGVGKSALAAEVVRRLANDPSAFPGGVAYVYCERQEGVPGLTWVYDRLLDAWDAPLSPAQLARAQEPAAALAVRERALRERLGRVVKTAGDLKAAAHPAGSTDALESVSAASSPALVLLDNVEEALPLAQALRTLGALGVTVLTTSRHRPVVPGLNLLPLDVLERAPAVALFAARYGEAGGEWDAARDAAPAAVVVEQLGWLPLAIELAAAYAALDGLSVAGLAVELTQHSALDATTPAMDPQRSVRYAFSQTFARLDTATQLAFATLGLPAGSDWPRTVIEEMLAGVLGERGNQLPAHGAEEARQSIAGVGTGGNEVPTATAALTALAARSLVALAAEPRAGDVPTPRVRLHQLLREYAGERYAALKPARQTAVLTALLEGVATFSHAHDEPTAAAFAILAREEALLADTIRRAGTAHVAPQTLSAAVDWLHDYIRLGGHWQLGTELRLLQLAAQRAVGNRASEGRTLNNLGGLARRQGHYEDAARYHKQALAILREVGNRAGEGTTLDDLGTLARNQGYGDEAARYHE
jgi:hypothetical protein